MRKIFSLLFLLTSFSSFSQYDFSKESKDTIVAENKIDIALAIRGKIIAGLSSPEDDWCRTGTLGTAFSINRHSLGVDYTFFRQTHQTDKEDVALYNTYKRRRYFLLDYKFRLFDFSFDFLFSYSKSYLYINFYDKMGLYKEYKEGFNFELMGSDTSFLRSYIIGEFNEPGLGIGGVYEENNFGIDISMNYANVYGVNNVFTAISPTESTYEMGVSDFRKRIYIRINLFYRFSLN